LSGVNYTYFAARGDTTAAAVLTWPRGLHKPPTDADAAGLLSEPIEGVGFSQELGRLAKLIMGTGTDIDLEDWEHRIAGFTIEGDVILKLPPTLVRAITDTDIDRLHSLVPAWAQWPHFADPDPDRLRAFATDLHRLCRTATENTGGVYSYGWA
jgi:hypothetical protein